MTRLARTASLLVVFCLLTLAADAECAPCQVAFSQLKDEVPRMPDEAATSLEEPLLETRQRPALDGERQDQSA